MSRLYIVTLLYAEYIMRNAGLEEAQAGLKSAGRNINNLRYKDDRELDCEEGWALKNWCFWTVVLEKTLESPLDWKEIQPVHSEGDQPWDFFGRNDAKAETELNQC